MTTPSLDQLQADADAISVKSPAIRKFAQDAVAVLRAQAGTPQPPAPPPPAPGTAQSSRWYAPSAAVNTPIPANPPIHPNSPAMVAQFVPQGSQPYNLYFIGPRNREAVAYPDASTPPVTVQINYPTVAASHVTLPIPAGVVLAGSFAHGDSENYLVVMTPDGDEWQLYDVTPPGATPYPGSTFGGQGTAQANTLWQAAQAVKHSPGWLNGSGTDTQGGDSGLNEGFGVIRLRDLLQTPVGGNWGHVINWTSWNISDGTVNPRFVPPATYGGDGRYSDAGAWPDGSRWQLDPAINIDTWPSMQGKAEWLKQMARTLQVYGMMSAHGATGQGDGDGFRAEYSANFPAGQRYPWQAADGSWPDPYSPSLNLPPDLLPHFRVIDWTRWTGA